MDWMSEGKMPRVRHVVWLLGVCLCLGPARSKGLREVTSYNEIGSLPPSQIPRLSAQSKSGEENVKRHRCVASTLRVEEACSSLSFSLIIATIPGNGLGRACFRPVLLNTCPWSWRESGTGWIMQGYWMKGMDFWKRRTRTTFEGSCEWEASCHSSPFFCDWSNGNLQDGLVFWSFEMTPIRMWIIFQLVMPLPELLGTEVRSAVSSDHCHLPSASQHPGIQGRTTRGWSQLSPTCPSGTNQGNLACETQGGYRTKPRTFSGSLSVFPLYNYVSQTVNVFPSSLCVSKSCFVIKSGCQFILFLKMRTPSLPGILYSSCVLDILKL